MAFRDPVDKAMIRLEMRRFASRCDVQNGLLQRADSLREVARLANLPLPHKLSDEYEARDAQRAVVLAAESRARELVTEQVGMYLKGTPELREKYRSKMIEDWANLTGPLGHLRTWARNKLTAAEQSMA
jgi:hypothetical protein